MNVKIKLGAYVALIGLTAWFGQAFYSHWRSGSGGGSAVKVAHHSHKKKAKKEKSAIVGNTNAVPGDTNSLALSTNAADQGTNATTASDQANATNGLQTAAADTNTAATDTNTSLAASEAIPTSMGETISGANQGKTMVYLALFVLSAVGLGLMIAYDLTHAVGSKAGDYLFDNVTDGQRDPEYEKAEQVWADGNHLEAIQMLRDYYKRNPRQVHAALRIAEIYEKDLRNYLASALEYEEVLKQNLPGDRWAWAAIHLCNLYSRIGQQEKTVALLRRIAEEHPKTAAAKKARNRLGLPEPDESLAEAAPAPADEGEGEQTFDVTTEKGEWPAEAANEGNASATEESKSNLPPGFRPKK